MADTRSIIIYRCDVIMPVIKCVLAYTVLKLL